MAKSNVTDVATVKKSKKSNKNLEAIAEPNLKSVKKRKSTLNQQGGNEKKKNKVAVASGSESEEDVVNTVENSDSESEVEMPPKKSPQKKPVAQEKKPVAQESDDSDSEEEQPVPKKSKKSQQKAPIVAKEDDEDEGDDDEEDEEDSETEANGMDQEQPPKKKSKENAAADDDGFKEPETAAQDDSLFICGIEGKLDINDVQKSFPGASRVHYYEEQGMAFIKYDKPEGVESWIVKNPKSKVTLGGQKVGVVCPMVTKYVKKQTAIPEDASSELFINGFGEAATESDFMAVFEDAVSVRIVRQNCFITMPSVEDACRCVENLNGIDIAGSPIFVKFARPRGEFKSPRESRGWGNEGGYGGGRDRSQGRYDQNQDQGEETHELIVRDFGEGTDENALYGIFPDAFRVKFVGGGAAAFVKFNTRQEALSAIENANGKELNGGELSVSLSKDSQNSAGGGGGGGGGAGFRYDRGGRQSFGGGGGGRGNYGEEFEVFVSNIPEGTDEGTVKSYFPAAFKVKSIAGGTRAFVKFNSKSDADAAVSEMNGQDIGGSAVSVEEAKGGGGGGGGGRGGRGGDRGGGRGFRGGRGDSRGRGRGNFRGGSSFNAAPQGKVTTFDDSD